MRFQEKFEADNAQRRLEGKRVPPETMKVIEEELEKFSHLEPSSMEFNITRNYLDWLTVCAPFRVIRAIRVISWLTVCAPAHPMPGGLVCVGVLRV